MRTKEERTAFGSAVKGCWLTTTTVYVLAPSEVLFPDLLGSLKFCPNIHIIGNRLPHLPHFVLFWIYITIWRAAKIYNVIAPRCSPCRHPTSSWSRCPEYITKIFHYKLSCLSEMNTNSTLFDLITLGWSSVLSPKLNHGWAVKNTVFLSCFLQVIPAYPHSFSVS